MSRRKTINLYQGYAKKKNPLQWKKVLYAGWLPPLVLLLLCLGVWGFQMSRYHEAKQDVNQLEVWLEEPSRVALHEESVEKQQYYEKLMGEIREVNTLTENLNTYPVVDSGLLESISGVGYDAITMTITGYDAVTGELSFEARSGQVIDIPDYVEKQIESGLFRQVDYTGYEYKNGVYVLSMRCILKGTERESEVS